MNNYQSTLWNDLMALVNANEAFFYADQEKNGTWYRLFNYRLASYTDFMNPNALECRGHMFEIDEEGEDAVPVRLAAMPMEKFFNLNENPSTMNLDLSKIDMIEDKADGSLISTFWHPNVPGSEKGRLAVKSKGSLTSDQALDAMAFLTRPENHFLYTEVSELTAHGFTINMEWVAPHNRIVLGYEHPELRILSIRDTSDGEYMDVNYLDSDRFSEIERCWTQRFDVDDPVAFVASIPDMQGIEGFVVRLESGQRIKIKTTWYLALHHTKDNINSPRRLFEAVLEEATDDMKTLFHDDPLAIKTIEEMEAFVEEKYNHMVDTVERFYERNKHLERKEYAILGQDELKGTMFFGLAMSRYLGKEFSYKDFLKKKWKDLGLKDTVKVDD